MTCMSNNEWNDGHGHSTGPGNPPGESGANEWGQGAGQSSAPDWNQMPQPPAFDREPQPGGAWAPSQRQEWNTGAHPQTSANEWQGPPAQQGWNQNAYDQQGWNQNDYDQQGWNQNPQGGFAPGQQWQPQPARKSTGFGNVFDFSFKKFALPEAGGTIFLIVVIGFLAKWLFDLIWTLSYNFDFSDLMNALLGNLALAIVGILLARAFLEGMSALVTLAAKDKDSRES